MAKNASPEEVARHNDVTRQVIIGTLCEAGLTSTVSVRLAREIMDVIARRGYEPQILGLNQLKNGKRI
jgi:hypothetical protein